MEKTTAHLLVIAGPDKGREFVVTGDSARLGRASDNDFVLQDPAISRFHCRFFFQVSSGLWAEDLDSANETLLNQRPLRKAELKIGDILTIGVTEIRVVNVSRLDVVPHNLFIKPETAYAAKPKPPKKNVFFISLLFLIFALALVVLKLFFLKPLDAPEDLSEPAPAKLNIVYEKVQANSKNIFRYYFCLSDDELSVQIDDLANRRKVDGTQRKKIDEAELRRLKEEILNSGFFELQGEYKGLATNVWDQWDLSVTLGRRAWRVKVLNTLEPDVFRHLRELLEDFGKHELGLTALALAPEKLLELAHQSFLVGRNFYDQRLVKNENLFLAIKSLREAEWYLETLQPKPDYYEDLIAGLEKAQRELNEIVESHEFQAERAIKLKDWPEAAEQLRIICDRIPDRDDERHAKARRRLVSVERSLKRR